MCGVSVQEAHVKYSYNPETGKLFSKRRGKEVLKNGRVSGKQLRTYQIAYLLMTGYIPETVDHKDGNRANNKWSNLREATRLEQSANTSKAGIRKWPSGMWYYQLCVSGKRIYKGGFATYEEAKKHYDKVCLALQGDFASQNRKANTGV